MSQKKLSQKRWLGIADYTKEGQNGQIPDLYYFGRAINFRDDPQSITLLPAAVKESGVIVTDLLKFADRVPTTLTAYFVGDTGNFYSRTSAGVWSNLGTITSSHGNGLAYFTGDDYVYITGDKFLSRYGPAQGTPTLTNNFLQAQGGVPTNTASILLASASSMYGDAADSTSLSVTGDITLETYFKANSLPTAGNTMTLIGKWDESGVLRSYKMDISAISGYFGAGTDGSLTISSNTTEAPIDSSCTGTAGAYSLSATNASFAAGQVILIHQSKGTNAGQWERNTINAYTAGTITLGTALIGTYAAGAQVRVLKQYSAVTINSAQTYTAKAWNGTVGGILAFLCSGTVTVTGTISADATGFRGGASATGGYNTNFAQGEGESGTGTNSTSANGEGGGGGTSDNGNRSGGGGGAGYGSAGTSGLSNGGGGIGANGGSGGGTNGSPDLTQALFGGGGGSGGCQGGTSSAAGGNGGGLIFIAGTTVTIAGAVTSNGANGTNGPSGNAGGGAGAGGSIIIKAQTATLGSGLITATGGTGGTATGNPGNNGGLAGGNAGNGRIALYYYTSYTGTTSPSANVTQDSTLVTNTTYSARIGISSTGSNSEYLSYPLSSLSTGVWNRLSISWVSATSTANFYLNGVLLGTQTGTLTAIHDNTSLLYIGANKGASAVQNFFDGYLNDTRIWANAQTASQIAANLQMHVQTASAGLSANYYFNSAATDATANANTLTLVNTPTYSTDVPFSGLTSRLDLDKQNTNTGQVYTLPTSISEAAADKLSWTPAIDPQASVAFYVDTKGTGNWTVTVHDQQNRVIATQTIANSLVPASGAIEFIFSSAWRITAGTTYHMHLTVSTGTSKCVTGTASDFSTAEYATYFQFLVTDTQFHPVIQFQYQPLGGTLTGAVIIGNERYIAVWDGMTYTPNFIAFPPGWHVRCFGFWRQYLAIGMWRGGNIYDFDHGRIYFWAGYQPAFDFFVDVPEGQINAIFGVDSDLYIFAGYRGFLLDYKGGFFYNTGNSSSNKLKKMPLLSSSDYTEVYPGALNMWRGILHFGLYTNSDSTTAQRGVYSYGSYNQYYPDTLSYDYVISTGSKGSTVSIGLVYPIGKDLIIGWKDGITYGADKVNFTNNPAPSGELQMLIFDNGNIWKNERSFQAKADFLPLNSGESIAVKVNKDREGWTLSDPASTDTIGSDTFTKLTIASGLSREVQVGVEMYATGSTSPTLLGLSLLYDDTAEENQF